MKPFMAWDGEGYTPDGTDRQNYMLFGWTTETGYKTVQDRNITSFTALEFIGDTILNHPVRDYEHISFAFGYDVTMLLRDLPESVITEIMENANTNKMTEIVIGDYRYKIHYRPKKWFKVSLYKGANKKLIGFVNIQDAFTFFQTSLVKACEGYGIDVTNFETGKAERGSFAYTNIPAVFDYWKTENRAFIQLMEALRTALAAIEVYPAAWHGPGAVASAIMGNRIKHHRIASRTKRDGNPQLQHAIQQAYFGGRFEVFHVGRANQTVYSADINSAYPAAIRHLPDLTEHEWHRIEGLKAAEPHPYSLYLVSWSALKPENLSTITPLPLRTKHNNIYFPDEIVAQWFWSPEIIPLLGESQLTVHARYQYGEDGCEYTYPLRDDIERFYALRLKYKAEGNAAQLACKLSMNSIYGKLAQTVGYQESQAHLKRYLNPSVPDFHHLEWAGYITAYCRGRITKELRRLPFNSVIAVETDGFYTTYPIDLPSDNELGGWEVKTYNDMFYAQSGTALLIDDDGTRTVKRRGFGARSLNVAKMSEIMDLPLSQVFNVFGSSVAIPITDYNRFINIRYARHVNRLQDAGKWVDMQKQFRVGSGKRTHGMGCSACLVNTLKLNCPECLKLFGNLRCDTCRDTLTLENGLHELFVHRRDWVMRDDITGSYPVHVPWEINPKLKTIPTAPLDVADIMGSVENEEY